MLLSCSGHGRLRGSLNARLCLGLWQTNGTVRTTPLLPVEDLVSMRVGTAALRADSAKRVSIQDDVLSIIRRLLKLLSSGLSVPDRFLKRRLLSTGGVFLG